MSELKGKIYDFRKREPVSRGENKVDDKIIAGKNRPNEMIDKAYKKVEEKIENLRNQDFSQITFENMDELAQRLSGKSFLEQKIIIEQLVDQKKLNVEDLISLYKFSREGYTKVAVMENMNNISESGEKDRKKAVDFLSRLDFDYGDEAMKIDEDFFFQPEDETSSIYIAKKYFCHHDDDEIESIFEGAKIAALLGTGEEGEEEALRILDNFIEKEKPDEEGYPGDGHISQLILSKMKEKPSDRNFNFILDKITDPEISFDHWASFIKFFQVDAEKFKKIIIEKISSEKLAEEKMKTMSIAATDIFSAEEWRDKLNAALIESRLKSNHSAMDNLEYARSFITPNHDKVAIENLQKFYQENIKFEEYEVNKKMNKEEVALLRSLIDKNEKVLEMGCGAGRLIVELAKDGYDATGFDFTPRHVDITQKKLAEAGARAEIFQGDWHNMEKIEDESQEVAYSLGRNILHDYSIADQAQLFRETNRILRPGGQFIFDIPDREKGGYQKMVEGYATEMKKREIGNFRYGTIYDSPDGKKFATRYAYSHEDIEHLAKISGFRILKIEKRKLETGQDDENLYYVLEKI